MANDFNILAVFGQTFAVNIIASIPIVDVTGIGLSIAAVENNRAIALIVLAIGTVMGVELNGTTIVVIVVMMLVVVEKTV